MECKSLRDSDEEIRRFDVAYFMASTDTIEDNTRFAQMNEATFPILADPTRAVAEAYGVLAEPGYARRWTFYIDPEGIIRKIDQQVKPGTAGEQLVSRLEALNVPLAMESQGEPAPAADGL